MSMSVASSLTIALRALSRNKLQTALTTIGMTIGVATVLTMIALGTGAEAAIEQQVRAAGMNLIVVTAGNYKAKTEDDGGGVVDHQARLSSAEGCQPSSLDASPGIGRPFGERTASSSPPSTPKTIRWRSTITRPRASGSATSRRGSARRRR